MVGGRAQQLRATGRWRAAGRIAILALVMLIVAGLSPPSIGAQEASAVVSFIQGIPNQRLDVTVDGAVFVTGIGAEQLTAPRAVPAGPHVFSATAPGGPWTVQAQVILPPGANVSVIAHIDNQGSTPSLSAFVNDVSAVPAGMGRLIARHLSTLPTVDVEANGGPLIAGFAPGAAVEVSVPADTYAVAVKIPPDPSVAFGPLSLPIGEGEATIVNVIGAAAGPFGPYSVVVQRIGGIGTPPAGVNAGDSGLVAPGLAPGRTASSNRAPVRSAALICAAVAVVTAVALLGRPVVLARRRSR